MASIWANVWFTRSTAPLTFGWEQLVAILRSPGILYTACEIRANLEAVVREYGGWASPEENVPVDDSVSRELSSELDCSD